MIAAIINRATAANYSVLLELTRAEDAPEHLLRFGDRRSDGTLLLDGRTNSPVVATLRKTGVPTVMLVNPDAEATFGSVDADFRGGAVRMVRRLIALGHRRIAHLADGPDLHSSRGRRQGYEQALREAGIEVEEDLIIVAGFMRHHGYAATDHLLDRRSDVTAFFCVNDLTALGAVECLRAHGLRVPEDASVTGYDDIALARHATPPLSTVRIPWYAMSEAATAYLIDAVEGKSATAVRHEFPVEVVERGTTGPVPST